MSRPQIVYTPHPGITPETEASALASIYRFLLDHHAKKEAVLTGGPNDAKEAKNDCAAKTQYT